MRTYTKYIFFIFLISNSFAQSTIAVLELEPLAVTTVVAKALSDRLRYEIYNSRNFIVIERGLMDEILDEQGFQLSGCVIDACIVEAGKLLAVENIIGGSISKVGSTYSVSIRFISVETGKVIGSAQKDFKKDLDYILTDGMALVARDLLVSLKYKEKQKITTPRLPLQDYGLLSIEVDFLLRKFSSNPYPLQDIYLVLNQNKYEKFKQGISIKLGYYNNYNLISIGEDIPFGKEKIYRKPYTKETPSEPRYEIIPKQLFCTFICYERFFPKWSLQVPFAKSIFYITPSALFRFEILPYKHIDEDYPDYNGERGEDYALKCGIGFIFSFSKHYDIKTSFMVNTLHDSYFKYDPIFNFGFTFNAF